MSLVTGVTCHLSHLLPMSLVTGVTCHLSHLSLEPLVTHVTCHWSHLSPEPLVTDVTCHWSPLSPEPLVTHVTCHWSPLSPEPLVIHCVQVCGHRYVSASRGGAVQGVCYESGRNLSNFQTVLPCLDRVSASLHQRSGIESVLYNQQSTWCMGGLDVAYMVSGMRGGEGRDGVSA